MECPELRKIKAGDEVGYICKLDERLCKKEYQGKECEEYNNMEELGES